MFSLSPAATMVFVQQVLSHVQEILLSICILPFYLILSCQTHWYAACLLRTRLLLLYFINVTVAGSLTSLTLALRVETVRQGVGLTSRTFLATAA